MAFDKQHKMFMHDWRLRYNLMISMLNLYFGILSDCCLMLRTWESGIVLQLTSYTP